MFSTYEGQKATQETIGIEWAYIQERKIVERRKKYPTHYWVEGLRLESVIKYNGWLCVVVCGLTARVRMVSKVSNQYNEKI